MICKTFKRKGEGEKKKEKEKGRVREGGREREKDFVCVCWFHYSIKIRRLPYTNSEYHSFF